MTRALAACVVAGLLVAACGEGGSEEEAMVDAISASILQDQTFAGYEVTRSETTCVANATVDGIGVERLSEIGFNRSRADLDLADLSNRPAEQAIDLSELSDGEVGVIARALETCIEDIDAVLVDAVAGGILRDDDTDGATPISPEPADTPFVVDEDEATCIAEQIVGQIPASRLITASVRSQAGDDTGLRPGEVDVYAEAYTSCIDVEERLLAEIAPSASSTVVECLRRDITDEDIHVVVVAALVAGSADGSAGATEAQERLDPVVERCTGR